MIQPRSHWHTIKHVIKKPSSMVLGSHSWWRTTAYTATKSTTATGTCHGPVGAFHLTSLTVLRTLVLCLFRDMVCVYRHGLCVYRHVQHSKFLALGYPQKGDSLPATSPGCPAKLLNPLESASTINLSEGQGYKSGTRPCKRKGMKIFYPRVKVIFL